MPGIFDLTGSTANTVTIVSRDRINVIKSSDSYTENLNGIIPALKTTYSDGLIMLRVVPRFEVFDFELQMLRAICMEYVWVDAVNKYIPYVTNKYVDNRFTADNTVLIDVSQGGQLVDDLLSSGGSVNQPYVMGQFTGLRLSQLGSAIISMIQDELSRDFRN